MRRRSTATSPAPDTGVVNLDNVRTTVPGRAKVIRTGLLESFLTHAEIGLSRAWGRRLPSTNRYVVVLNTNEGSLSLDLLNRALPIHLESRGDVTELLARSPIGDLKIELLPKPPGPDRGRTVGHGRALGGRQATDEAVRHPMGPGPRPSGASSKSTASGTSSRTTQHEGGG